MKFQTTIIMLSVLSAMALVSGENDLEYIKECGDEFGVTNEDIDMYIGGVLPQSNPSFKNMLLCYYKKLAVMDDAGMIVMDKMKEGIMEDLGMDEARADKMMDLCIRNNAGGSQGAWDLEECYLKNKDSLMM